MLELRIAWRSELGAREANEDAVRVGRAGDACYALLADGAGGHARGAEASQRAVDAIERALRGAGPDFATDVLVGAVQEAHAELQQVQRGAAGRERMHTTLVALWIDAARGQALWAHVGDSRLYRFRHGRAERLTVDDSVVQRMVEGGLLTPEQAHRHPQRNQLVSALGMDDAVEPMAPDRPEAIDEGDAFLLCCDGWWDALDDVLLARTLAAAPTPEDWLADMQRRIVARAIPRQDNFSAVAVWVGDPAQSTRFMSDDDTVP